LEELREYGVSLLRQVAADWEARAGEFERMEQLPEDGAPAMVIRQYRWAANMLRGRARAMELEPFIE